MKRTGKGKPLSINPNFTSKGSRYKSGVADVAKGCEVVKFRPLRSWPFKAHERQVEMDAYQSIESAYRLPSGDS